MDDNESRSETEVERVARQLQRIYGDPRRSTPTVEDLAAELGCGARTVKTGRGLLRKRGVSVPRAPRRCAPGHGEHVAAEIQRRYGGRTLPAQRTVARELGFSLRAVTDAVGVLRGRNEVSPEGVVAESRIVEPGEVRRDAYRIAETLKRRYARYPTGTPIETRPALAAEFGVREEVITDAVLIMAAHDRLVLNLRATPTTWNTPTPKPPPQTLTEQVAVELAHRFLDRAAFPPGAEIDDMRTLAREFHVSLRVISNVHEMLEALRLIETRGQNRRALISGGPPLPSSRTLAGQIALRLEARYRADPAMYPPGTPIGSLQSQATEFHVSRSTIETARDLLVQRRVILRNGVPREPTIAPPRPPS